MLYTGGTFYFDDERRLVSMERLFRLSEHGTTVRRELIAGITTFLTMSYILAVNPNMLSDAGLPKGAVFTATVISSLVATLIMGLAANLPVALAPGMGLNAFFTYAVVIGMEYSWQIALTAVFLEGVLFIFLSLFNVREAILKAIPGNLKRAVAVGIGLFIALIGLKGAGVIVADQSTLVAAGKITSGTALIAIIGIIITITLYAWKIPGSILLGILATTLIGVFFGVTTVPEDFRLFRLPSYPLVWQFDFRQIATLKFFTVFFTFLFVDIFDTVGTLVGVATQAGLTDAQGNIPRVKQAFLADAIGTALGAAMGTSTVTSYVESTAGVAAGARTGLASAATAGMFFIALFLSPLFLLIPPAATTPALVVVGFLMMRAVTGIDFSDLTEGIPAFITIVMMPFTYSIAEGIVFGILSYVIIKTVTGRFKDVPAITWILFLIFILRFFTK
jgi:AGZA family xanthine/uracil permease-like MFS transporter